MESRLLDMPPRTSQSHSLKTSYVSFPKNPPPSPPLPPPLLLLLPPKLTMWTTKRTMLNYDKMNFGKRIARWKNNNKNKWPACRPIPFLPRPWRRQGSGRWHCTSRGFGRYHGPPLSTPWTCPSPCCALHSGVALSKPATKPPSPSSIA